MRVRSLNAGTPPAHVQCKSERRVAGCAGSALTVLAGPAQLRVSIERARSRAFTQAGARRRTIYPFRAGSPKVGSPGYYHYIHIGAASERLRGQPV